MQVFNFGSINIDLVYRVPHLVAPGETLLSRSLETVLGGKGANQSVALARAGARVVHIGRLGQADSWAGDQLLQAGVDTSLVATIEGPSGHAIIQVDDRGENSIILHGGANQSFSHDLLANALESAEAGDWLLMQNECNALDSAFSLAASKGLRIAFNPAPMTPEITQLPLERCALLIVNETEAAALAGDDDLNSAIISLGKKYPDTHLVLTLGSKGAMLQRGPLQHTATAMRVSAVDTTGAGDTFVGYFLASLMEGLDDERALHRACAAGALSVTRHGATPGIPTRAELNLFLDSRADDKSSNF
ncbi:MAG: ribokinase [Granulosicoccus sp.]